ncbi:hypothetical protein L1049_008572 [Liquidambar formosana]|uniref:SWIM-type domain-containing protein n=1 Tax=Liquidambar formosana TaxID=63359 RepID=A0AAP0S3Q1_LIQFO
MEDGLNGRMTARVDDAWMEEWLAAGMAQMVHDETRAVDDLDEVDGVDEAYGVDGVDEVDEWMEDSDESGSDSEISVRSERILFGDPDEDNLTDSEGIHNEDVEALIDVAIRQRDVGGGAANVVGAGEVGGGESGSVQNMGWISFPECDVESDYAPSDELVSLPSDSDDDILIKRDVLYNRDRDLENPKLILGMKFGKYEEFRELLRKYSIVKGFDLKFKKNNAKKITAECKKLCGWRIHASWTTNKKYFQIKNYQPKHGRGCGRNFKNTQACSTWLAHYYLEKVRDNPEWNLKAMRKTIKRELMIDVSKTKVYRTKRKALQMIEGKHLEQYNMLWDYCHAIRTKNPTSYVQMKVERYHPQLPTAFQRLFISFAAQIRGFLAGCRPFIGLDGCFLKGCYGGQLLSAVGRDGNNQMFPVAMAVVEAETKETWNWFMRNLLQAIDCHDYKTVTFISDRQKGLVDTFKVMMPGADHRYCLRHMYSNFKEKHKGQDLKDLMWKAASCYTVHEFETHMEAIKKVSVDAYNWLLTNHPSVWSISHFSPRSKCDMLCNNPSESWNKYILEAREKPIITMLEMIRRQLMNRFQVRKQEMEKWEGPLCPKIQEKFDRVKEDARHCEVIYAGDGIYEIEYKGQTTVVNLGARTCMCRKWEVTGIPCSHAVAAILRASMNPEDFVDECYHKVTNGMAYAPMIYPIGDPTNWAASGCEPVGPPPYRKAPGRPKKARKKGQDETPAGTAVNRKNNTVKCKNCKNFGHNSRSCKSTPVIEEVREGSRGKGGRPPINRGGRPPINRGGRNGGDVIRGGRGEGPGRSVRGRGRRGRGEGMGRGVRGRERGGSARGRGRGSTGEGSDRGGSGEGNGRGESSSGRGPTGQVMHVLWYPSTATECQSGPNTQASTTGH